MIRRDEHGAAIVMALVAASLFAYAALLILQAERAGMVVIEARMARVRLAAAADAGLAIAMQGIALANPAWRWPPDGTPRRIEVEGVALTVTVEDERGKVPVNQAPAAVLRRLLAAAEVPAPDLDPLAEALADWIDADTAPRPNGAERDTYRALGTELLPRDAPIRSLGELLAVRGMNPDLLARLAPVLTLYPGGRFEPALASPLARQAMADGAEMDGPSRVTHAAGAVVDPADLRGRTMTIRVEAGDGAGGRVTRQAIVEYTGSRGQPVWVREYH